MLTSASVIGFGLHGRVIRCRAYGSASFPRVSSLILSGCLRLPPKSYRLQNDSREWQENPAFFRHWLECLNCYFITGTRRMSTNPRRGKRQKTQINKEKPFPPPRSVPLLGESKGFRGSAPRKPVFQFRQTGAPQPFWVRIASVQVELSLNSSCICSFSFFTMGSTLCRISASIFSGFRPF